MLRARPPLLHFRVSLPTQRLPRPAGVIRGFYTGAVQVYLTFSLGLEVERPTSKAREKRPGDEVAKMKLSNSWSNCSLFLA